MLRREGDRGCFVAEVYFKEEVEIREGERRVEC
jgi:hypothetical protein